MRDGLEDRERECAALDAAVDALSAGEGRAVVVEGPAGIGKSALLEHLADAASTAGVRVLRGRCGVVEAGFPHGITRQLLEPPVHGVDERWRHRLLEGPAAAAGAVLGVDGPPRTSATPDPAFTVLHALRWVVRRLAEDGPVALLIDDVQWCDDASAAALALLATLLDDTPLLLGVARRTPGDEPPAALEPLLAGPESVAVRPEPLGPGACEAVLERALGEPVGEALAHACREASGGNPFLLRALAAQLADAPQRSAERVARLLPETVRRSVVLRLRPLDREAIALAQAVAVLGEAATLELAARLAGVTREVAADALDALGAADVLAPSLPPRFVHPLVATAVSAELPAGREALLHAAAARLLAGTGAPAGRVGAHLLVTAPAGDAWVVDALLRAAVEALDAGAVQSAAALARRALDEPPPASRHAAVQRMLGRALARSGSPDGVDHLREAVADAHDPAESAAARLDLARALLHAGRLDEAAAIAPADDEVDDPAAVALLSELLVALRLQLDRSVEVPQRLTALVERSETGDGAARLLLAHRAYTAACAGRPRDEVLDLARRALADGALLAERGPEATELVLAANALSLAEARDEALAAHTATLDAARRFGTAMAEASSLAFRSQSHFRGGNLAAARADAEASIAVARRHGWGLGLPAAAAFLIDVLVEAEELGQAEALLAESGLPDDPAASAGSSFWIPLLDSRASVRAARGERAAAVADLREVGVRLAAWMAPTPSVIPWRSRLGRLLAADGEHDEALALAREEERLAIAADLPRATAMARQAVAAIRGDVDGLADAAAQLEAVGARLAHASCLLDLGEALRRARRPTQAREPLRRALDLAGRVPSARIARRAEAELVAAGGRPRRAAISGVDALTPSEERVARLAAAGRSNPEIAADLVLSRKTVEVHLTRAYRKLDVRSRAELADALAGQPAALA